jgi:imidazoleglycerol-phosphate dehydratase/histidinol-phosphatase
MVREYLRHTIDKSASFMIGDRVTDLEFAANLGVTGIRILIDGTEAETWPAITRRILGASRRAQVTRKTKETDISIDLDLSREGPISIEHRPRFLRSHAGTNRQARWLRAEPHLPRRLANRRTPHHRGLRPRAGVGAASGLGRQTRHRPLRFPAGHGRGEAQVALDISGRPYFVWEGKFNREKVGDVPTELVPHFFRSLAETLGAALHLSVRGENSHHMIEACFKGVGRSLRQAIRLEGNELPSTKGVL